jgi:hypothetical protein
MFRVSNPNFEAGNPEIPPNVLQVVKNSPTQAKIAYVWWFQCIWGVILDTKGLCEDLYSGHQGKNARISNSWVWQPTGDPQNLDMLLHSLKVAVLAVATYPKQKKQQKLKVLQISLITWHMTSSCLFWGDCLLVCENKPSGMSKLLGTKCDNWLIKLGFSLVVYEKCDIKLSSRGKNALWVPWPLSPLVLPISLFLEVYWRPHTPTRKVMNALFDRIWTLLRAHSLNSLTTSECRC